jgi:hypothetical protein
MVMGLDLRYVVACELVATGIVVAAVGVAVGRA